MPSNSATLTGGFTPQEVSRTKSGTTSASTIEDTTARVSANEAALKAFLAKHPGQSNPKFDPSTLGDPTYIPSQNPTRGFIRRSAPDSDDAMSTASLNFMYNPESVVRDYVSYLDQEALDPFNTVYGSGNLIAPPSFITFSFNLFFDRQVQCANGAVPRGVLEDYDFFDMVVRNVTPGGGTTAVPDNGIMMVNPKDITVVFSKDLTVQGRPTNARVVFERFNNEMTPTRMTIRLDMIITYFGPLRDAFTFDTNQSIKKWEATIPYSQVYSEEITEEEVKAAEDAFNKSRKNMKDFVGALPRNASWSGAANTGAGVMTVAAPASGDAAARTLAYATGPQGIIKGVTKYTQGSGRANLPISADCSGALWCCYKACGVAKLLAGSDTAACNTHAIEAYGKANGWKTMRIVAQPRAQSAEALKRIVLPGDVLLRTRKDAHTGFFHSWDPGGFKMTHQTSGGNNGTVVRSIGYLKDMDYILRPVPAGSTTSTGTWPSGPSGGLTHV